MAGLSLPGVSCPCGSGRAAAGCCGRIHRDPAAAETAEQLMRARFSAFALGAVGFLRSTWAPETRPSRLELDDGLVWLRLEILDRVAGSPADRTGIVEFRAHYVEPGGPGVLHERSRFRRGGGRWYYIGGEVR